MRFSAVPVASQIRHDHPVPAPSQAVGKPRIDPARGALLVPVNQDDRSAIPGLPVRQPHPVPARKVHKPIIPGHTAAQILRIRRYLCPRYLPPRACSLNLPPRIPAAERRNVMTEQLSQDTGSAENGPAVARSHGRHGRRAGILGAVAAGGGGAAGRPGGPPRAGAPPDGDPPVALGAANTETSTTSISNASSGAF